MNWRAARLPLIQSVLTMAVLVAGCSSGPDGPMSTSSSAGGSAGDGGATSSSGITDSSSITGSSSSTGGDPCSSVECNTPPAPMCQPGNSLRTFDVAGECVAGACSYPYTDTICPVNCNSGVCTQIATSISAGATHTCAVVSGAVKCWGGNGRGQLGNNSTTDSPVPVEVTGLGAGVLAVSAGSAAHACALTSAGAVMCWGSNVHGQLGDSSTTDSLFPVEVTGLGAGILTVSAGADHTCALTSTGVAKCWGSNVRGGLGNNSTIQSSIPVDVTGLGAVGVAISTGFHYTCAVTSAGAVKCWGSNGGGQLGNNSTTNSSVSTDVTSLGAGVIAVSASFAHACALTSAGAVKCWGSNQLGKLGNSSMTDSLVPVEVTGL